MYISAVIQIGLFYDVGMYTSGPHHPYRLYQCAVFHRFCSWDRGCRNCCRRARVGNILDRFRPARSLLRHRHLGRGGCSRGVDRLLGMGRCRLRNFDARISRRAGNAKTVFYFLLFGLAFVVLVFLRWLYSTNFGLAINAIRDDEEKAEAMGLHTRRYKRTAWAIAAFFLGIAGAIFGNMTGFIEPRDVAFPTTTFNIFMILMVLLGGKGTFWGPSVRAVVFHVIKEVTWTYFLGWQFVALGLLIVIIVVYFQQGIVGWLMEKYPERFGIRAAPKEKEERPRAIGLAPHPEGAE